MSQKERPIADTQGRFLQAIKGGSQVTDPGWSNGRILLSNRRVVLVGKGGKRTIPLDTIDTIKGDDEVHRTVAGVSNYTSLRTGEDVLLLAAKDHNSFEIALCSAMLADDQVLLRHPAVEGGVVQETEWLPARVKLGDDDTVNAATKDGSFVAIEIDDVGKVETAERSVRDADRTVVEIEHTQEGTSVETHFAGSASCCSLLASIFGRGLEKNSSDIDLDGEKKQVLMALYSGVSPFEIPEFTGVDVETVEETYEELIELDVLSEIRKRREVELTPRGRNLASEAISDE